jgi:hypothetical protein
MMFFIKKIEPICEAAARGVFVLQTFRNSDQLAVFIDIEVLKVSYYALKIETT